ncbi:MAG: VirB4 family type IV secretion/conjugal transfer ATPase [Acidiferrobacteraceae bacterium]
MRSLTEFRTKAYGLPDLLPWAALVDDGVVLTKAGGLLAGWSYRGPDLDSATGAELAAMAARINAALCLGDGWVLNCDALRAPAPGYAGPGAFPDRTTRLIDEVRRARYAHETPHYVTRYVLTLTWFPAPDAAGKTAALFLEGGKPGSAAQQVARFKERIREIEGRLGAFLELRRLVDRPDGAGGLESELLGYLEACVSFRARRFRLGMAPMYLDAVLGRHDLVTGFTPRVGDLHLACLAIEGFPAASFPGILDVLSRLPVSVRWSNRFIFLDPEQAGKLINRHRSRWSQKRKSLMNVMREQAGGQATHINLDMEHLTQDAIAALAEASSGAVRFGHYTSVLLLADADEGILADSAREVRKLIEQHGFGVRLEDLNAVEAYLGSVPGNTWANVRRPVINTLNLAHLLPFTSVYPGPEVHPCPFYPPESPPLAWASTDGATPFRLCLHVDDVGHSVILGPTGAGKSTLLGLLMAQQFRYPKAQVFAFDKGYSALPLVWAAGGEHYDLAGSDGDLAFCPLAHVDEPLEQVWAAEWLGSLAALQGVAVTPRMRDELYQAAVHLGASTTEGAQRTLTHYLQRLQSLPLREALKAYALGGALGQLLDAERDGLGVDRFQVFEMEPLMQLGDKALLPVLTYLFHQLEQRFQGAPTLLVLDEAWVMLGHPVFREKIREWLKVLRKANVAVVFATQSLSDLARSGIADVVFESCPTKLLLPNPEAMTETSRLLYTQIGLNSRQIDILATAVPKRQYYLMQPGGRRLFELGLSAPELAFIGASGKEDIARIRALRTSHGEAWPAAWLRERGAGAWAEVWERY